MNRRSAWFLRPHLRWRDSFVACDGGTLFVKLLGFIDDQEAELLDVREDLLRLRIGRTWWERWWHGRKGYPPLEVRLDIRHATGDLLNPPQRTRAGESEIDVSVKPLSPNWNPRVFQSQAERVVHRLRRYLLAG